MAVLAVLLAGLVPAAARAAELPPGGSFVDDNQSVHEAAIEAIADEGITSGCGEDEFCPRQEVTRGQMAAFLTRALGLSASGTNHFDDDNGHLFEADIDALAAAGITTGCNPPANTSFCPDDEVTRGQMAAFLVRAGDLASSGIDHFADDGGHRFASDIDALADAGITTGCNPPDNTAFCPDDVTLRGQMASFLTGFLGLDPIEPPEPEPEPDPSTTSVLESIQTWFPAQYEKAVRVADCESSLNPAAVNWAGGWHGLFQIAEQYHRPAFERVTGQAWEDGIYVAYYNAQFAKYLYDQSDSWSAWGCRGA